MSIQKRISTLQRYFKEKSRFNKYSLSILLFVVWLSFFDKYNLFAQYNLTKSVDKLENQKMEYEQMLDKAIVERETIEKDIEKYGREKYLFHKENEEIILIK